MIEPIKIRYEELKLPCFANGEEFVAMQLHKERLIIATNKKLYEFDESKGLIPIQLKIYEWASAA